MASLQTHLERLRVPLPALQQTSVIAVFDALIKSSSISPAARDAAVAQCLACDHPAATEAAVQALLRGDAGQLGTPLQDLLIAALAVAPAAAAAPLANGVVQLFTQQLSGADSSAKRSSHTSATAVAGAWRSHPLSKALLANPAAGQPLLLGVARLLTRAADASAPPGSTDLAALLAATLPFLNFALLDPALQQQHPALAAQLHACLARVACCSGSPASQAALLRLLAARLPALRLQGAERQAAASSALADVMDVLESCGEEPDSATLSQLASSLVCMCHEAAAEPAPALVQQLLAALSHLASYWPQLVAPHTASLARLLVQNQAALGGAELQAVLRLLSQLMQHIAVGTSAGGGVPPMDSSRQPPAQLAAVLLMPLLQHVAFASSRDVKQWAAHALGLLRQLGSTPATTPTGTAAAMQTDLHGAAAASHAAQQLLAGLWDRPLRARHWLASLRMSLSASTAQAAGGAPGGRAARDRQQVDSGALLVLCALLQHPDDSVVRAALQAAGAAVDATPLLGLPLLPLLVQLLQRQVELFLSGKRQQPPRLLLDILRTLPGMGRHPATLPFVLRTLQQLLSPGAPEVLQAAGLRLMCRLWQASGGRAYPQLRAAVIGYAAPGQQPGPALRVARAECLRDICADDPDKAVELAGLLQECLRDESPAVQAIALDCIALLCESDVLEFYAAWRVVHRALPRLPDHPAAAAAWVRLLGSGGLDAAVQPDAAAAIIDALWLAAGHEAPQVRRQAYGSLAAFSLEVQEQIGALRPLWHYLALLRAELAQQQAGSSSRGRQHKQHRLALAECEALVQAALAYEHANRRRTAALGPVASGAPRERGSAGSAAAGGGSTAAALAHRLQSVLPKQLLGGSTASAAELLQRIPELPPTAVLYFYAPAPPAGASKAAAAVAAKQAAADYQAVFAEVVKQGALAAAAPEDAAAAVEMLDAWAAFLRRWLAAVRAAAKQQEADVQQAAASAALQVWEAVQKVLTSGDMAPAAACNAALAAAALCNCTPQPLLPLVTAVHGALVGLAEGRAAAAAAVQRAALAALGAIAEAVRVALGGSVADQVLRSMQQRLGGQGLAAADVAAAATGLGLACRGLASPGGDLPGATQQLVQSAMRSLLQALCATWAAGSGSTLASAAAADGIRLDVQKAGAAGEEAQSAVATALALALPAAASSEALPSTLRALHAELTTQLTSQPAARSAATTAAACMLLQAVAQAGFASSALSAKDVSASLRLLLSCCQGTAGTAGNPDGRVVGSAAAGTGTLLAAALQSGFAPPGPSEGPEAVLQQLLSVPEAAGRLAHAAAAKRGAAAGLAALVRAVDAAASPAFKTAVGQLESLALKDSDPRSRRACAAPLAALCHAVKRAGGLGAAAGAGGNAAGAAGSKGLQQLAADGVLRPLLESLLEGSWVLPESKGSQEAPHQHQQESLTASSAAALLRCAAAAQRLPAMSFGMLCARLQRSHGSCDQAEGAAEVEQALVAFAAAHGGHQQCQLDRFAADLLSPPTLQAASAATQEVVLASLPQLLGALPEAEAARVVPQVAAHVCGAASAVLGMHHQRRLLLRLLQSLSQLLDSSGGSTATLGASVQAAAVAAFRDALLAPQLMPAPGCSPCQLAAAAGAPGGTGPKPRLAALQQRCWAAALCCLQALPAAERGALLQVPGLPPAHAAFAAACLVAGGQADARALQHPRNMLLLGQAASGGTMSKSTQQAAAQHVACAVATLPAGQQQQWLLDVLDACPACANPAGAFQLAACIAASTAAATAASSDAPQLGVELAMPASAAVLALPATLLTLLAGSAWQGRRGASGALLLQRLAGALQHLATNAVPLQGAPVNFDSVACWSALLRACLLSVRHCMPADGWPLLASLL